jgi:succinyl-CoA synthetase beta subunit
MNIHEYQARQLLGRNGVALPPWELCDTPDAAQTIAERFLAEGADLLVVKAQIHAGGRGKGTFKSGFQGGVRLCKTAEDAYELAKAMLGQVLVTKQTGPEGRLVRRLIIAAAPDLLKEFYLAVLLDRALARPVIMASTEGGVDIEEVAAKTPEKIVKQWIDPAAGLMPYEARTVAAALGLKGDLISQASDLLLGVYKTWWEFDASLVEINPLCIVRTREGLEALTAVDAKISLDDNALYRHPDLQAMRDPGEESPLETAARGYNLSYIQLDGNIACLVNGAGLAMSTMDIIQHFGGRPANFLDVGGGASQEQVAGAFRIILQDPNVKAILVNIFGGIMDCNVIATGIIAAVKQTGLKLPLVVRLEGNNVEAGNRTLAASGLKVIYANSMADAAQKVVKTVTVNPVVAARADAS